MIPKARDHAVVALFILSMLAMPPVFGQSPAAVTIKGRIINGTAGAAVPQGLKIIVVALSEAAEEIERRDTTSNGGTFSITVAPADRHVALATHLNVTYSALIDDPTQVAELRVFETTEDDAAIEISSDTSTVIKGERDNLEVLALMRVKNISDRTFVGRMSEEGEHSVLRYPVPPGAYDVNPGAGITRGIKQAEQGFTSSDPVLPGEASVGYLYRIRAPRSGWSMLRPVFYPTSRVTLLVDEDLRVSSPRLRFTKKVHLGEEEGRRTYVQYDGRGFQPGDNLEADITYLSEKSPNVALYLGAIAGAILLLSLAVIVPVRRRNRARPGARPVASDREQLIDQIAALDDAFESHFLEEEEYLRRRGEMKSRLEAMTEDLSRR